MSLNYSFYRCFIAKVNISYLKYWKQWKKVETKYISMSDHYLKICEN